MTLTPDVAIVGGGPSGSTCAALLKKYAPQLDVLVLERERFPRDHVGESQLPPIGKILNEMGCWDEVEAAEFPVKVGATYRWGTTDDLWDFDFVKGQYLASSPRPAPYAGLRTETALQVDRALYDDILLRHAAKLGADVRQETRVVRADVEDDRILGLELQDGTRVEARHYVDASGHPGVLRRALGVETDQPTLLQNIAIWDYWRNAEWAERIGVGGTRVQVMSLGYGWIWFIPLGPDRTSLGLVVPARYYKEQGLKPRELYDRAIADEPRIAALVQNATREEQLATTKDWSFVSRRAAGSNWLLAGESCGFADPILAAGMTLAQQGAREAAFTILELDRGEHAPAWLREGYEAAQLRRLNQHIRFADYWYSANAQFTDLKEFTRDIAADAGLDLDANAAFQWLGTGGFTDEHLGATALGSFDVRALKLLTERLGDSVADWAITKHNQFAMNLKGAEPGAVPFYHEGRVAPIKTYFRDGRRLPVFGVYQAVMRAVKWSPDSFAIVRNFETVRETSFPWVEPDHWRLLCFQTMEGMVTEGWITATLDPSRPCLDLQDEPLRKNEPVLAAA